MLLQYDAAALNSVRGLVNAEDAQISIVQTPVTNNGTTTPNVATLDFLTSTTTLATITNNFRLEVVNAPGFVGDPTFSVVPGSESVCSVNSSGQVTRNTTDGTANVYVDLPTGRRKITRTLDTTPSGTIYGSDVSYPAGSLMKHINDRALALCQSYGAPASIAAASAYMRYGATVGSKAAPVNTANWLTQAAAGWTAWTAAELEDIFGDNTGWVHANYRVVAGGLNHGIICPPADVAAGLCMDLTRDSRLVYGTGAVGRYINVLPSGWESKLKAIGSNNAAATWYGIPRLTAFARMTNNYVGAGYEKYLICPIDLLMNRPGYEATYRAPAHASISPHCTANYGGSIGHGGDSFSPIGTKINSTAIYLGSMSTAGGGSTEIIDEAKLNAAIASMASKGGRGAVTIGAGRTVSLSSFNTY